MGFWSNLFRQIDDNVYNETKKDEQETQKCNNNLFTTQSYEQEFLHYLQSIGSNAFYIAETNISSTMVKDQIDRYKRKFKSILI